MSLLSEKYEKTQWGEDLKPLEGTDAYMNNFIAKFKSFYPHNRSLLYQAKKIHKLSLTYELLSDEQFNIKIKEIRKEFCFIRKKKESEVLHKGFAIVCEASFRSLNMRPYTVQIMGALAMYKNFVIQMHTGEGKTITAALTAVLHAWSNKPCHIVTSNDYLALRDAEIMKPLYHYCHLTVDVIEPKMKADERISSYKASVVYATSNEILADFLRDQMHEYHANNFNQALIQTLKKEENREQVLRGLHSIIIDEADSVLADEAITPLIISVQRENEPLKNAILAAKKLADKLEKKVDYNVNVKHREVYFTPKGEQYIVDLIEYLDAIWQSKNRRTYLLKQAIMAKEFHIKEIDYVIENGKLIIVDEKTGRLMPNRSWSAGMHQAVEAKEEIELSSPTETHSKMSFQRFFRLYENISGMSGTLQKLKSEFWHIYSLPIINIPKRIPNRYKILEEKVVATKKEKWKLVVSNIEKVHKGGQPILIGTRSIDDSERLALVLEEINISHQVLNAFSHENEAQIIENAGEIFSITIATNMAGRGTDIKISKRALELGGLYVISTERHDSRRVDMQLFGRSARQGQPGVVQAIVSLEDELLHKKSSSLIRGFLKLKMHSVFWQKIALIFYKRVQNKSDKKASKMRKKILKNDFAQKRMLSFSEK